MRRGPDPCVANRFTRWAHRRLGSDLHPAIEGGCVLKAYWYAKPSVGLRWIRSRFFG